VGEAVGHAIGGVAAGEHAEGALQFVVTGLVEEKADSQNADGPPAKENYLARSPAFTEGLPHGI